MICHTKNLLFTYYFQVSERKKVKLLSRVSDPMDCSLPGSSVHGIFLARVLEWVAIAFSESTATDQ